MTAIDVRWWFLIVMFVGVWARSDDVRDPTKPLVVSSHVNQDKIELHAIFSNKNRKYVIVNGINLEVGQVINGYELEEIGQGYIVMNKHGIRTTHKLGR